MTMTDLALLVDSTDEVQNTAFLKQRMEEEGYLFFSQLVSAELARQVKCDIILLLREHHILENDGGEEPLWSGGPLPTEAEYMAFYDRIVRLDSFQQLAHSPEVLAVLEGICGEPVKVWEQKLIRIVYPDPKMTAPQGIGAHQDGDPKLGYQANHFYTGWIAIMDIDHSVGGLAISPRSHKLGILQSGGTVASSAKNVDQNGYGLEVTTLPWESAEFQSGSAVLFHCHTAHRGLPNHSERLRLSCDFRYQPTSQSASWVSKTLGPDVRRVAQQIDELLAGRAFYVTCRPTEEIVATVRQRMMEEKSTTLARAQELVDELCAAGDQE